MKTVKQIIIFCIRLISKFFRSNNLRACRFYPSCSEYSVEAFQKLNIFQAFYLMLRRILSCHPFSEGGYDPLPSHERSVWWKEKLLFFWRCHFCFWGFIPSFCSTFTLIITDPRERLTKRLPPLRLFPAMFQIPKDFRKILHPRLRVSPLRMIWRSKIKI